MKKLEKIVIILVLVVFGATFSTAHIAVENNETIASMEAELALIEAGGCAEVIIDGDNLSFLMGLDKEEAEGCGLYDGEFVYISHNNAFSCYAILHFDNNDLLTYNTLLSLENDIDIAIGGIYTAALVIAAAIMLASLPLVFHFFGNAIVEAEAEAELAKANAEARASMQKKAVLEAALEAEAEAIIAEAVEALAHIEDNDLVVFNTYSLEYALERCCRYICRGNIDNLKEALDNLVYRK